MTTTLDFDVARLLLPIPGPDPAGEWLRYGPEYDLIKEARRQDDPSLPQGVWKTEPKRADWEGLVRLCADLLETRTKDVQIACWLVEALVQCHGFAGLAPGLAVLEGLCRLFWDGLHPGVEPGAGDVDPSARVAPFEWLNAKLPTVLLQLPATRSGVVEVEAYTMAEYLNARRLSPIAARDPKAASAAAAAGQPLMPTIEASMLATPAAFHRELHAQLAQALAALEVLGRELDARCGPAAPGMVGIRDVLTDILGWVETILRNKGEEPAMPIEVGSGEMEQDPDFQEDGGLAGDTGLVYRDQPHGGPIRSREEAYYRLAEAAEFLFRTEPHSPVPYLIQRVVSWGSMPLPELLLELSRGRNDLAAIFELLGFGQAETTQKNTR